jgi:hypothetical protein
MPNGRTSPIPVAALIQKWQFGNTVTRGSVQECPPPKKPPTQRQKGVHGAIVVIPLSEWRVDRKGSRKRRNIEGVARKGKKDLSVVSIDGRLGLAKTVMMRWWDEMLF